MVYVDVYSRPLRLLVLVFVFVFEDSCVSSTYFVFVHFYRRVSVCVQWGVLMQRCKRCMNDVCGSVMDI